MSAKIGHNELKVGDWQVFSAYNNCWATPEKILPLPY